MINNIKVIERILDFGNEIAFNNIGKSEIKNINFKIIGKIHNYSELNNIRNLETKMINGLLVINLIIEGKFEVILIYKEIKND